MDFSLFWSHDDDLDEKDSDRIQEIENIWLDIDKVKSDSYKTNIKEFLDNSHDFHPFEKDISKYDIQELPIRIFYSKNI